MEIAIVIHVNSDFCPRSVQKDTFVVVDNVVLESKGEVVLHACRLDLVEFAESEDVIADDVFFAVMLMEAAVLYVVNEVVFHSDSRAALVGIQSPSAVSIGVYVMDHVVADCRPFGRAERIYAPHVTEYAVSDMVHVVVIDFVAFCKTFGVPPAPTYGNSRVVEIADIIVSDLVVTALSNPDSDGTWKDVAGRVNDVIVHYIVTRSLMLRLSDACFADSDTACTDIVYERSLDPA
jgi:hypothetical protein